MRRNVRRVPGGRQGGSLKNVGNRYQCLILGYNSAMDSFDMKALRLLATDGRAAWSEVARRMGFSAPSAAERVRQLEKRGVIRGYEARMDPKRLGYALTAFVAVTLPREKVRARSAASKRCACSMACIPSRLNRCGTLWRIVIRSCAGTRFASASVNCQTPQNSPPTF